MISSSRDHHTAHLSSPRFIFLLLEQLKAFENLSKLDSDPIILQRRDQDDQIARLLVAISTVPTHRLPILIFFRKAG